MKTALTLLSVLFFGAAKAQRTLDADLKAAKGPTSRVWQDTVGAGRAAEGLRAGWREQLAECRRELGFGYLRMHGLLHDELGVYSEDKEGRPRYNWQYINDIYDYLLSIGVRPFVELGFMPKALASGNQTIFWWNGNVTPPKDYAKWDALIVALVKHWTDRYGADEVRKWRFEVWNEPNLRGFWSPAPGVDPKAAYYELYEHTAKDVRSVDARYAVGGPSVAWPEWVPDFVHYCTEKSLPLDFLTWHSYGLGNGPGGYDLYGNRSLYLNPNLHAVAESATSQNAFLASVHRKLPVHITEWSASYSPRDPVHDAYFEGPFMLEQLRRTESVASMSYWTFTDVFEENGPVPRPFHGGFGLINFQGIKKPAFWAYRFLSMLGATELKNADPASYVCRDAKGGVQLLAWDLTNPVRPGESNQDIFFKPVVPRSKGALAVRLRNVPAGRYRLTTYRIGYRQNDPYTRYLEMGSPADLSREQVAALKGLSTGKFVAQTVVTVKGDFTARLPMRENDVVLLTLEPLRAAK